MTLHAWTLIVLVTAITCASDLAFANDLIQLKKTTRPNGITQITFFKKDKPIAIHMYNENKMRIYKQGSIPNGIIQERTPNKRIKAEFTYNANNRQGPALLFYRYPSLIYMRETYANDALQGIVQVFNKQGQLIIEKEYQQNKLHGLYKIYFPAESIRLEMLFKNGKREDSFRFYHTKDNRLLEEVSLKGTKLNGLAKQYYYPSGQLKTIYAFKEDHLTGYIKEFYENQALKNEFHCNNDQLDGLATSYDEKGNLLSEETFKNGVLHGPSKYYDPQTQTLTTEIVYKEGVRDGVCAVYDASGNKLKTMIYKEGILNETY